MNINLILESLQKYLGWSWLQNKFVFALVIIIFFVIIAKIIEWLFNLYLKKISQRTKTNLDDLLFERCKGPLFYLIVAYSVMLAITSLEINGTILKFMNSILAVIFIVLLSRALDSFIKTWGEAFAAKTKTKVDEVLLPLFHKAINVIFIVIGFIWVLKIWELNIAPYLAGVGISGLVLGLALQDSLKNVFGGVSLLLDKNFHLGDPIQLEDGQLGTIQEIGLRSTKMLTYDNEVIFIPNGLLANMKIRNYLKPNARIRKQVDFSVAYGTKPEDVKKVVLNALQKIKDIYDDPYMDVIFTRMGDSGIYFKARFWVDWNNAYSKYIEATQVIYDALNEAKIDIPFPTRTVHLKNEK